DAGADEVDALHELAVLRDQSVQPDPGQEGPDDARDAAQLGQGGLGCHGGQGEQQAPHPRAPDPDEKPLTDASPHHRANPTTKGMLSHSGRSGAAPTVLSGSIASTTAYDVATASTKRARTSATTPPDIASRTARVCSRPAARTSG